MSITRRDNELKLRNLRQDEKFMAFLSKYYAKRFGPGIGRVTLQMGGYLCGPRVYDLTVHAENGQMLTTLVSGLNSSELHIYLKALELAADWIGRALTTDK